MLENVLFKGLQREFPFAYLSKDPPTALLWMTFWRLLRLAEYAVSLWWACCWCPYYLLQGGAEFLYFVDVAGVLTIRCKGYGVSLFRGCCWCPYYLLQGVWSFSISWVLLVSLLSTARECGVSLFRLYCCPS